MSSYQLLSMLNLLACGIICAALTLLVLLQLRHDRKSQLFARLTVVITGVVVIGILMRMMSVLGNDIYALFTLAGVLTGAIPVVTFQFTNEYLETWTPRRRLFSQFLAICLGGAAIIGMSLRLYRSARISPEGFFLYEMYPGTVMLLGIAIVGCLATLWILAVQYQKRKNDTNVRVLVGIGIMTGGVLMLAIPTLNKYTLEQILYVVGALVIAGPVFQQRLFDPLTQLNTRLVHRAEQFSALTRISQQTTSLLTCDTLLDAVTREILASFGYTTVAIYLPDLDHAQLRLRASASTHKYAPNAQVIRLDMGTTVGSVALTRHLMHREEAIPDAAVTRPESNPGTRSEVCIPLLVGDSAASEEMLIGVLDIQSEMPNRFSQEDIEVLQILSRQTATAIHNAQLFEETQRARQVADEASRQKTSFLATMSHELRTPLQTIITHSQWMLQHPELYAGIDLPEVYRPDMASVHQSTQHLHSLINNILDLSKIEAGEIDLELSPVDPSVLINEIIKAAGSLLKPGVVIQASFVPTLPSVWADGLRLQQVLMNIVSNACKFCEQGQITVNAQPDGTMLCFSIADTGIGIPVEAQATLFNPFKQANRTISRQYGGTGLGLSICQELVHLMGGKIWFQSEPGKGTTFFFTIPLASAAECALTREAKGQRTRAFIFPKGQKRPPLQVMVIEPRPLLTTSSIEIALNAKGYKTLVVSDASKGLSWALAMETAAVVIIRERMPSLTDKGAVDAIGTLKGALRATSNTKIIDVDLDAQPNWLDKLLGDLRQCHPDPKT